jgi:hypothetical protein
MSEQCVPWFRRALVGIIALILVSLSSTFTIANAPAPPAYLWLQFDRAPQAVQLLDCRDLLCETPTLLAQRGTCQGSDCFKTTPILSSSDRFACAHQTCLYQEPWVSSKRRPPYFKLIAQFSGSNSVKASLPFISDFRRPIAGYGDRHLIVTTHAEMLMVRRDERIQPSRWQTFSQALGITQGSELAIGLAVLAWRKFGRKRILTILLTIGLVNFLTFPVVWFFFSSLQSFQYSTTRVFGVFFLIISVLFSTFLIRQSNLTPRSLLRIFTLWFFSTPLLLILAGLVAFLVGYGEALPSAIGLPSFITLPASEIYAVLWEAWLIRQLNQSEFNWRQALLLSTLMNALSLILGLVFLPQIQPFG